MYENLDTSLNDVNKVTEELKGTVSGIAEEMNKTVRLQLTLIERLNELEEVLRCKMKQVK
ncbi:hypothetical protein ABE073_03795 [Lederbergia citrisecunda]|uniref:hypothetical protein n=1 Tax=Lederbergia citrisecunda TaxID=2833583 RepID=UPI003D27D807